MPVKYLYIFKNKIFMLKSTKKKKQIYLKIKYAYMLRFPNIRLLLFTRTYERKLWPVFKFRPFIKNSEAYVYKKKHYK